MIISTPLTLDYYKLNVQVAISTFLKTNMEFFSVQGVVHKLR